MNPDAIIDSPESINKDLELIRELIRKYGLRTFNSMVQVASFRDSTVSSSGRSVISNATLASRSTVSSNTSYYTDPGSIGHNPGEQFPWRRATGMQPTGNCSSTSLDSHQPVSSSTSFEQLRESESDAPGDVSRSKLQCPLCTEFGIIMPIGRKPDLKRHLKNMHGTNAHWVCKLTFGGGCDLTFDFRAAYEDHTKKSHGGVKDPEAKVNLCQQVVFACGFERCREVFEAQTDKDGQRQMNIYVEHILTHMTGSNPGKWSHSRRIRNLLHQTQVHSAWKECNRGNVEQLQWQPQSSSMLRKLLECRHLVNIPLLCKYAVLLGSSLHVPPVHPGAFTFPVLNTCAMMSLEHSPRHDHRFSQNAAKFRMNEVHRLVEDIPSLPTLPILRSSPSVTTFASHVHEPSVPHRAVRQQFPQTPAFDIHPGISTVCGTVTTHDPANPTPHHPLEYFTGFESLGEPPSQDQVVAAMDNYLNTPGLMQRSKASNASKRHVFSKKSFEKLRGRRNSSPEDCRMGESPPPMPAPFSMQQDTGPVLRPLADAGFFDPDFAP